MPIIEFESLEEMAEAEEANRKAADSAVNPQQAAATIGSKFIKLSGEVVIYGEILDPCAPPEDGEEEDEDDRADREAERETRAMPHMANYRFTRSYSKVCPEGELGDVHVSTIVVLSEAAFQEAKSLRWPSDRATIQRIYRASKGAS